MRGKAATVGGGVVGTEKEFQTMGNILKLREGVEGEERSAMRQREVRESWKMGAAVEEY